ncbi:MAG: alpha-L-fucosidase [Rikenellaceae bacterium]
MFLLSTTKNAESAGWFQQIKEVIDAYQPDQIWFDFDIRVIDDKMKNKFATYYYSKEKEWGKELIITRKFELLPKGVGVLDIERGNLGEANEELWQTDDAIAVNSWCWVQNIQLKPTEELVHNLIDIVSKNGVLLLNPCPKADGTIPEDQQEILLEIGHFLKVNGEAIYSTRPFRTYGEGPNLVSTGRGKNSDSAANKFAVQFGCDDIRYTRSKDGKTIYAIALGWPEDTLTLRALDKEVEDGAIKKISLLGSRSKVKWSEDGAQLNINTAGAKSPVDQYAYVWKIELK